MTADLYRKLAMAARVLNFLRTHPSTDGGYLAALARFEAAVKRAEALAAQEQEGRAGSRAGVARRKQLRALIYGKLVPQLTRVAALAARDHPDLAAQFVKLPSNGRYARFTTLARSLVSAGEANAELLGKSGLSTDLLSALATHVGELELITGKVDTDRDRHVGARAELVSLTADILALVGVLDGFNRYRFRDDPEAQAAWDSARNVPTPTRQKGDPTPPASGESKAS